MAEPHVITALTKKYAEISGQLAACEIQAAKLQGQLDHIKAALRLFNPEFNVKTIQPKRPIRRIFRRNLFMRTAMDVLREAKEPMTTQEITVQAFKAQGMEPEAKTIRRFGKYLEKTLIVREKDGSATGDGGYPVRWRIAV